MRYFKKDCPHLDETEYLEFEGGRVRRQITVRPDITLLLKRGEQSEVSLDDYKFTPAEEICIRQFGDLWENYLRLPHGTTRMDHPLALDLLTATPQPTSGDITLWDWDPRLDHVFAAVDKLCKAAARPSPVGAPAEPPLLSLAGEYVKNPAELTARDLLVLVRWIRPWLQDDLNAFRFYLPHLARFYHAGRVGADFELTLLLYQDQLTREEQDLLTEVIIHRVQNSCFAWDCAVALFWYDDYSPLREVFLQGIAPPPRPDRDPDKRKRELWRRLRALVARAEDPVWYLWDGQYDCPKGFDLFDRLSREKGERIVQFLREVHWRD